MARKEIKAEEIWNSDKTEMAKQAILEYQENNKSLKIPDIRNKLSPITNMIALFERGEYAYIKNKSLDEVKRSINYLSDREVYEL